MQLWDELRNSKETPPLEILVLLLKYESFRAIAFPRQRGEKTFKVFSCEKKGNVFVNSPTKTKESKSHS